MYPARTVSSHRRAGRAGGNDGHAQEILNLKKRLNEIYVKHTGQTYKAIEDALERDKFLTAEMAKDFGIVDKVIDKRPEEPASLSKTP